MVKEWPKSLTQEPVKTDPVFPSFCPDALSTGFKHKLLFNRCTLLYLKQSQCGHHWVRKKYKDNWHDGHNSPRWPLTTAGPCSWWWWRPAASEGSAGTAGSAQTGGPRPSPTGPPDASLSALHPRRPSHADAAALWVTGHAEYHNILSLLLVFLY